MSGAVFADISMSLDGFITGPNDSAEQGLGEGGERLHQWLYDLESWNRAHGHEAGHTGADDDVMGESIERSGAFVMGRRMFELGLPHWGDEPPFHKPVFVLTHEPREPLLKADTRFTFVSSGIEEAVQHARAVEQDKDVSIAGGAQAIQETLKAGLLDEIQIHLVSVLMGAGVRLFEDLGSAELDCTRVIQTPGVVHLRFDVVR